MSLHHAQGTLAIAGMLGNLSQYKNCANRVNWFLLNY